MLLPDALYLQSLLEERRQAKAAAAAAAAAAVVPAVLALPPAANAGKRKAGEGAKAADGQTKRARAI